MWQHAAVIAIVIASAAYAAWTLLPAFARGRMRNRLARFLARWPGPAAVLARRLAWEPAPAGGCTACPASARRGDRARRR